MKNKFNHQNLSSSGEYKTTIENRTNSEIPIRSDHRHTNNTDKLRLEQMKNYREFIKLLNGFVEIGKIRASSKGQVEIIEAKTRQLETEAELFIDKIKAETSQIMTKRQIAVELIKSITNIINENQDVSDIVKIETIKAISSIVNVTLG